MGNKNKNGFKCQLSDYIIALVNTRSCTVLTLYTHVLLASDMRSSFLYYCFERLDCQLEKSHFFPSIFSTLFRLIFIKLHFDEEGKR